MVLAIYTKHKSAASITQEHIHVKLFVVTKARAGDSLGPVLKRKHSPSLQNGVVYDIQFTFNVSSNSVFFLHESKMCIYSLAVAKINRHHEVLLCTNHFLNCHH